jgi:hypothetical protein
MQQSAWGAREITARRAPFCSMRIMRPLIILAPFFSARSRRYWSNTSRRHMPMYSVSESVLPTSTSRLEGEIIFILVTLRSMMDWGRSNSSTMHRGMAPPQGCEGWGGGLGGGGDVRAKGVGASWQAKERQRVAATAVERARIGCAGGVSAARKPAHATTPPACSS